MSSVGFQVWGRQAVIYIQHEKPTDPDQPRSWLPAPAGSFRFAFRYYGPMSGLLDGSYDMPGIVRTG